jgi:hypothetical protein
MSDNKIQEYWENMEEYGAELNEAKKALWVDFLFDANVCDATLYRDIHKKLKQLKQLSEHQDDLCYEIDEINRKWAEDNERNGDILSEQQNQIIALEEENKQLKNKLELSSAGLKAGDAIIKGLVK